MNHESAKLTQKRLKYSFCYQKSHYYIPFSGGASGFTSSAGGATLGDGACKKKQSIWQKVYKTYNCFNFLLTDLISMKSRR